MLLEELTDSAIDYIIAGVNTDRLNDWEKGFFESVAERWESKRILTDKQKETLGRIWDKQP